MSILKKYLNRNISTEIYATASDRKSFNSRTKVKEFYILKEGRGDNNELIYNSYKSNPSYMAAKYDKKYINNYIKDLTKQKLLVTDLEDYLLSLTIRTPTPAIHARSGDVIYDILNDNGIGYINITYPNDLKLNKDSNITLIQFNSDIKLYYNCKRGKFYINTPNDNHSVVRLSDISSYFAKTFKITNPNTEREVYCLIDTVNDYGGGIAFSVKHTEIPAGRYTKR